MKAKAYKQKPKRKFDLSHRGYEIIKEDNQYVAMIGPLKLRAMEIEDLKKQIDKIRDF
tara:strand:- start:1572 stop:1745 length:174 start_codon:yes stop_codon:yes gene_type:complete